MIGPTLVIVSAAVLVFWAIHRLLWKAHDDLDRLPGPNMLSFTAKLLLNRTRSFQAIVTDYAEQYGAVYRVKIANKDMVVLSDFSALQEGLITRGKDFADRRYKGTKEEGRGVVSADYSPRWRALRKAVHQSLKLYGSGLSKFEDALNKSAKDLVSDIKATSGQPFDPFVTIYNSITKLMATIVTGEKHAQDDDFIRWLQSFDQVNSDKRIFIILFPFLRFIPPFRTGDQFRKKLHKTFLNKVFTNTNETDEYQEGRGIMSELDKIKIELLNAAKEEERFEMTDLNMLAVSRDLLAAGTMTTTATLYTFLCLMLHHTDIQTRLAQEVEGVLGTAQVTLNHRHDMPYTRAVIFEVTRYASTLPLLLPHITRVNTEVQGYRIPAQTRVVMNVWAHHHNQKDWEDPWRFNPERFLDSEGKLIQSDHPIRRKLLAFGAGPRLCLGEKLALNRLFLFIVTLIQNFTFLPPSWKELSSCDPRDYIKGVIIRPRSYKMRALFTGDEE